MKNVLMRLPMALKAAWELGPQQAFWYAVYQSGLRSGQTRRATPAAAYPVIDAPLRSPFTLPERSALAALLGDQAGSLIAEAEEILHGQVRLFGGPPVPLQLAPPDASRHWADYEGRPQTWGVEDIKLLWEPARFGWVYPLGRAYVLTGDERFPAGFWQHLETFLKANPPNQGPNWTSGQEVALRLLALLFAACAFSRSEQTTPERARRLAGVVAAHAARIPPTLSYARAQQNNHRVSEALGLYAAGWAIPNHPKAQKWLQTGWQELNRALQRQIQPDGTYTQHSLNYHRLMLHDALQGALFVRRYPLKTAQRLAAAAQWLLAQVDPLSGDAPNLGSNDGANILPLAAGGFRDYRPAAQAAARAFIGYPAYPPGPWDETGLWLGQDLHEQRANPATPHSPAVLRLASHNSWASLRAVKFRGRPSHADQLHVELWWRGENIALDPGTFRYTAADPWDNSLAQTFVHNTVEVNEQNQMQRAGRFLWLDWAQARVLNMRHFGVRAVAAQHDGYLHLGVLHRRILKQNGPDRWHVIDHLMRRPTLRPNVPANPRYHYNLHWLLPDWPWTLDGASLTLQNPRGGYVRLSVGLEGGPMSPESGKQPPAFERIVLVRAGELAAESKTQADGSAEKVSPILGWYSPTYNSKVTALSFFLTVRSALPLTILSDWTLDAA